MTIDGIKKLKNDLSGADLQVVGTVPP